MITWLDLTVEGDPHPRRFDRPDTALTYLLRVERLSEEAAQHLLEHGEVEPPLARRAYTLRPLGTA
ncbi:hypothetical protein GO986_21220 [Deinococcus sp. HMF7620]|uniref:Uncharacterized protein n=1 Tax=Deinococcus arboris TaxID=2682977 RepID=A0A7C9LXK7_9DEIO|nr:MULTISPECIES: hypothetical protein [Deinococcus]MBZ9751067.1 hypothetical protein [Deinococcus betulae]MVN89260.1 hypothetical protein [Deinococcus arboris]